MGRSASGTRTYHISTALSHSGVLNCCNNNINDNNNNNINNNMIRSARFFFFVGVKKGSKMHGRQLDKKRTQLRDKKGI